MTSPPFPPADPASSEPIPTAKLPQPTVTVRAVSENQPRAIVESLALARSLRAFGGRAADARCELHFVEELPADVSAFAELGVTLKVVERFDARCPHANKLRMFYECDTDYLLAVDTDVVVAGDFTPYMMGDAVAAAPAYGDWMPEGRWQELFQAAGLPMPDERVISPRFWQETIPYFNSGVIVVPARHADALCDEWSQRLVELLDAADGRDWWQEKPRYFVDQIAFAMAFSSGRFPRRVLPQEMNYSMEFSDIPEVLSFDRRRPLLLHTIHRMNFDTGELLSSPYEAAQRAVEAYNELLRA